MKGQRSHRPSSTEPDDWVDGSWTVDCSCGVNYDDGEEMVSCDECGIWVHTRCSSFVKGETSFACDKCKLRKRRNQENEETEVAQLLAELPTKTMRMDSSPVVPPPLRPDLPMDERVHVQGPPTGDFISFQGLGIFSPQLWKCTGYVPKSLNFQYREFPCWDEEKENVDGQVERPGLEVVVGLKAGIDEEHGTRDKSHYKHEQGTKGEKHHHGNHHRQGRRKKDEREHGGKKKVKSSGEKDKDEKLKRKSSSHDAGHGPRVLFRSLPNNPKAMRNLAAQKFMYDDIKLRSKVETNELPCHGIILVLC